jgi:hypothetical protein
MRQLEDVGAEIDPRGQQRPLHRFADVAGQENARSFRLDTQHQRGVVPPAAVTVRGWPQDLDLEVSDTSRFRSCRLLSHRHPTARGNSDEINEFVATTGGQPQFTNRKTFEDR